MNISEIIKSRGYPCENHEVPTDDGYLLSLQRIRHGRLPNPNGARETTQRPIVFLQHGLLDSAHAWVANSDEQSLAFVMADHGYEVWLGNSRGNTYSRGFVHPHNNRKLENSAAYWQFSWDEMAQFDLPACVNHVVRTANVSRIFFVGHSQGGLIALAGFPRNPELQSRIRAFAGLAPVRTVAHVKSPVRYLAPYAKDIARFLEFWHLNDFLPSDVAWRQLVRVVCGGGEEQHALPHAFPHALPQLCTNALFLLMGYDVRGFNATRLPVYLAHTPAGTSLRNVLHYAQMYASRQFQAFDFGSLAANRKHYNRSAPPVYSLAEWRLPTIVFSGGNDWMAPPGDVQPLLRLLAGSLKRTVFLPDYNHMDFSLGVTANKFVYEPLLQFFAEY